MFDARLSLLLILQGNLNCLCQSFWVKVLGNVGGGGCSAVIGGLH